MIKQVRGSLPADDFYDLDEYNESVTALVTAHLFDNQDKIGEVFEVEDKETENGRMDEFHSILIVMSTLWIMEDKGLVESSDREHWSKVEN